MHLRMHLCARGRVYAFVWACACVRPRACVSCVSLMRWFVCLCPLPQVFRDFQWIGGAHGMVALCLYPPSPPTHTHTHTCLHHPSLLPRTLPSAAHPIAPFPRTNAKTAVPRRLRHRYGGAPFGPQCNDIRNGVDIVVGTPGRIGDHLERRTLDATSVRCSHGPPVAVPACIMPRKRGIATSDRCPGGRFGMDA